MKRPPAGEVTLPPLIEEFARIRAAAKVTAKSLSERVGIARMTIRYWMRGNSPNLLNFEAALNAFGHKLVIVPINPEEPTDGRPLS